MIDKSKANKGELIPSINRSLARKKSGLVKRGLELIHELKKQQVRVLIGNFDDLITDLFPELIKEVIKEKYDLKVWTSFHSEEILELADKESVDVFILIINNIVYRPISSVLEPLENSLHLITQIKTRHGKPVIALSGWLEDSFLIERVKLEADFFFPLPFELDPFREAIEKCFDMLPGFAEVPRKRF